MTREGLIKAYKRSTGGRVNYLGKERVGDAEIPLTLPVEINQREIDRYKNNGLANIQIPMTNYAQMSFILDFEKLDKNNKVRQIWMNQGGKTLTIYISNGRNVARENAVDIEEERHLEGLLVGTKPLSRVQAQAQYTTRLIPLYSEDK